LDSRGRDGTLEHLLLLFDRFLQGFQLLLLRGQGGLQAGDLFVLRLRTRYCCFSRSGWLGSVVSRTEETHSRQQRSHQDRGSACRDLVEIHSILPFKVPEKAPG